MFSTFGGARKREHLFTFKRKALFPIEDVIQKPVEIENYKELLIPSFNELTKAVPQKPVVPKPSKTTKLDNEETKGSKTKSLPTLKAEKKEPEHNPIFDFPDSIEDSEIKVMIASTRVVPKLVRKKSSPPKSKPTITPKAKPVSRTKAVPDTPEIKKRPAVLGKRSLSTPTQSKELADRTFDIFDFDPLPTSNPYGPKKSNSTSIPSTEIKQLYHTLDSSPCTHQPTSSNPPLERNRKRNFVAHLKTASGQQAKSSQSLDFPSDDEEEYQFVEQPLKKERSPSPELSYSEKMELELESLMRSEFSEPQEKKSSSTRPRYQPLNKLNVRITF